MIDRNEKKEELEMMIKSILTYVHNYSRACANIAVDTRELENKLGYDLGTNRVKQDMFESDEDFYKAVKEFYDEIEKRKVKHLREGFDWNQDPFEDWTKEDWENY
jgi:hypothetical protein